MAKTPDSNKEAKEFGQELEQLSNASQEELIKDIQPYVALPADKLTDEELKKVVYEYAFTYKLTPAEALHSIAYWCQSGGYVKSVPDKSIDLNKKGSESLQTLRQAVTNARPKGTVRQLARSLYKTIYKIAAKCGYTGHLYKALRRIDPTITVSESELACEYYEGTDICSPKITAALLERSRLRAQTRAPKTKKRGKGPKGK
jgi:hypothetical protein